MVGKQNASREKAYKIIRERYLDKKENQLSMRRPCVKIKLVSIGGDAGRSQEQRLQQLP